MHLIFFPGMIVSGSTTQIQRRIYALNLPKVHWTAMPAANCALNLPKVQRTARPAVKYALTLPKVHRTAMPAANYALARPTVRPSRRFVGRLARGCVCPSHYADVRTALSVRSCAAATHLGEILQLATIQSLHLGRRGSDTCLRHRIRCTKSVWHAGQTAVRR